MQVAALYVYPIKSCRGVAVASAQLEARGLAGDRRYMLVDARGRFLTQRQHPRMALIEVGFTPQALRVEAPGMDPFELPRGLRGGAECEVRVWRDTVTARLAPEEVNLWFSEFLGFACGLVYMGAEHHRPVMNDAAEFDDEVSFADGAPVLLISTGSLAALNARLERPVAMTRFRPNIVVDADPAFAEDSWGRIAVGDAELAVAWPCSRCVLTTIDPATGEPDPEREPLATLETFRRAGPRVMFGQNLIPRRCAQIHVGDPVAVL